MDKDKLIEEAHNLAQRCEGKEVFNQIKSAFSYLIYHRDLGAFQRLLNTRAPSKRADKHWEKAKKLLSPLLRKKYSVEELLYILGLAVRLSGYYLSSSSQN